ncbi:alanine/glycine:cation symporter family protein [Fusobacterium perfoetens]|uniref:alanine/glycine:cation symporter family protein n=1 Tax=Fusobacterium perfoetens TaxID=852 RepID=UPI0004842D38|nr:alanine/glycine:cation symporter family protein [Fusobacterium perfoetens]MCI6152519.1 alanine:cation symporter family protein [Fusobacterium perfoetens]MDY3237527.1 alanine/glycine:cation symporter family protein [Fusobacterium perfoetens]
MEIIENFIVAIVRGLNNLLWGDLFTVNIGNTKIGLSIMVLILLPVGIMFTIRTKFLPFRLFPEMIRVTLEPKESNEEKAISGLQALIVATATRVGMGNLAGVAAAVSFGGAGAVFWMWIVALFGAATSFIESTLAQIYKEKDPLYGGFRGGPSYYISRMRLMTEVREDDICIEKNLDESDVASTKYGTHYRQSCGFKTVAILFSISALICWAGISQIVANSVSQSFVNAFSIPPLKTTIALVIISGIIIFKKNTVVNILDKIVPVMACLYLLITIFIMLKNIGSLPSMFVQIFEEAFGIKQVVSGGFGAVIMNGVKRGLFSNEAGSGSAPNAAAAAHVSHPSKQGLIQAFGVFIDTLFICSCSAFIILLAPSDLTKGLMGMDLLQTAMNYHIGEIGVIFIAVILFLFSFSTFLGVMFYSRGILAFLFGDKWWAQHAYKLVGLLMLFFGGIAQYNWVWDLGDLGVALMTVFNMIAIIPLSNQAIASLKDYEERRKNKE